MSTNLEDKVERLEVDMQAIKEVLQLVVQQQQVTAQQQQANAMAIALLSNRVDTLTSRVDAFVYEAQRLFIRLGEKTERAEAATDSLAESVARLTRNAEADRSQARASGERMNSMIDRLDRLVDYLIWQEESDRP